MSNYINGDKKLKNKKISRDVIIAEAIKLGIVNPYKVRDLRVRDKNDEMKKKGMKYDERVGILSEEFFVCRAAIIKILHKKK